jgi:predicted phage tail protein
MNQLQDLTVGGAGGGCFRKGTPVQLEHGRTIAIEKLKVGDEVLAFDEQGSIHKAKVTQVHHHTDPQPLLRVKYWGGELCVTPNHWVLNEYNAFTEVGRLSIHDCMVDGMGHLRPLIDAEYIGHEEVYNLTVEPHHTFIAGGIRVHNGGHRDLFPTIAGAGGSSRKGSGGRVAIEDPDSLQSCAMVSIIDLLGEGQIGGLVDGAKSIYLDDTPLMNDDSTLNFEGFEWQTTDGLPVQDQLKGDFGTAETPITVNVQVKKQQPCTFTVANPSTDEIRLIMLVPALSTQDMSTGDLHGAEVEFSVHISTDGGEYEDFNTYKISGKTRSRYQRAYRIPLPKDLDNGKVPSQWSIQVRRITDDSDSASLSNDLFVDSYSDVVNTRLSYPNSALVGITINSEQFGSIPKRSYLVDGLIIKVPKNYDPETHTYEGSWTGEFKLAVSDNPAWILYDLLTSKRYGLGNYIDEDMVDEVQLYQIGRYCDELVPNGFGGFEPRFTINTVISSRADAYQVIRDVSSAFNGMTYWTGGKLGFTQDAPSDPVMVFSQANVVDGHFQYSGSSRKDRHSVVLVAWNDPELNYETQIEYVEDVELIAKFGVRKAETTAFGCVSQGQANRVGKWLLYTERYQSEMVTFTASVDSAFVKPGDVVKIHDTARAGSRMGGRLKASTLNSATLDFPCDVNESSVVSIRMADGKFLDRPIISRGDQLSEITWAEPLPELPVDYAIWLISRSTLEPQLARVVGVAQGDDTTTFKISAVIHYEGKYDSVESGLTLGKPPTSDLDYTTCKPIKEPKVEEISVPIATGVQGLNLDVSWMADAPTYEVQWRREGIYETNWEVFNSPLPNFTIDKEVRKGLYKFRIVAINSFGARSDPVEFEHQTQGYTESPGDVKNFKVSKRTSDLLLTWDAVQDIDVLGYEIRVGSSWDEGEEVITNFAGTMITHDQDYEGTYSYHIRSINKANILSDNVSTTQLTLKAPATVKNFDIIHTGSGKRLELNWAANNETDLVHYEIREGEAWTTSQVLAQVKATSFTTPRGIIGTRRFWIKAVTSPGIYSKEAAWVSSDIAAPETTNIIITSDQYELGFPGTKINMFNDGDNLTLSPNYSRGEYVFEIDLGDTFSAQTSMATKVVPVVGDVTTWNDANWSWDSPDANRPWTVDGSADSVSHKAQIAKYTGELEKDQIDAWRLNGDTASVGGNVPSVAENVGYEDVRYGKGLTLGAKTNVEWKIPNGLTTFHFETWVKPRFMQEQSIQAVLELGLSDNKCLRVAYNGTTKSFTLSDDVGSDACEALLSDELCSFTDDDLICISVVQAENIRRLHVHILGRGSSTGSQPQKPLGSVVSLQGHWKTLSL